MRDSIDNAVPSPRSNSAAMHKAEQAFRQTYPTFDSTSSLDELRAREYARLDEPGHVYLDYTGGGLYAESQLREHFDLLRRGVFGNPHSLNPTSRASTELDERARAFVLEFFRADPGEYTVIFTSNATNALKLLGEAYPFQPSGQYLLLFDNHNSVNGIREFARARGATFTYLPVTSPELRVDESLLLSLLNHGGMALLVYSPIRPSPISQACSIPWNGSKWPNQGDGMCWWIVPPSSRPIAWTSPGGTPILSRFPSTSCSVIQLA